MRIQRIPLACGLLLAGFLLAACVSREKTPAVSAPPVFLTTAATNFNPHDFERIDRAMDAPLQFIPASDPRFQYQGRFDFADPARPVMSWQASRVRIDFEGESFGLRLAHLEGQSYFDVQVDDSVWILAVREGGGGRFVFQRPLPPGRHHLTLFKRTEATAGTVGFEGLELPAGAKAWAPAPVVYPLAMEFIGDSITVGACNEDGTNDQWDSRLTHNAAYSYAALTAGAFSADYRNISVSGMGMVTGYVDVRAAQVWNRTGAKADSPLANLQAWQPDLVFLNFGENDNSVTGNKRLPFPADFADAYVALVQEIRQAYPRARIVILRGGMSGGARSARLRIPWQAAVARLEAEDKMVSHFVFTHWTSHHPRVADDRAMAEELTAWLKAQDFMAQPVRKL